MWRRHVHALIFCMKFLFTNQFSVYRLYNTNTRSIYFPLYYFIIIFPGIKWFSSASGFFVLLCCCWRMLDNSVIWCDWLLYCVSYDCGLHYYCIICIPAARRKCRVLYCSFIRFLFSGKGTFFNSKNKLIWMIWVVTILSSAFDNYLLNCSIFEDHFLESRKNAKIWS